MPRTMSATTLTQSLMGMVALTALLGAGCDQWKSALQEAEDSLNGASAGKDPGGPGMGTGGAPANNAGSGGAVGAAVSCYADVNASGATCKTCVDATGAIVYEACDPPPTDAGTTGPVIKCEATTDASGRVCQTCSDETGKVVKTDCPGGSSGSGGSAGSGGSTGSGTCTSIDDGGPTSCKDPATWKQYGIDMCAQQKLTLTDLKPLTMCAGGYASVSYLCCR